MADGDRRSRSHPPEASGMSRLANSQSSARETCVTS
jgi:hypothetical protein